MIWVARWVEDNRHFEYRHLELEMATNKMQVKAREGFEVAMSLEEEAATHENMIDERLNRFEVRVSRVEQQTAEALSRMERRLSKYEQYFASLRYIAKSR